MESAQELAGIDGVTVLELDVAQPASIAAWADRVKAAANHVDVRALCAPRAEHCNVRLLAHRALPYNRLLSC